MQLFSSPNISLSHRMIQGEKKTICLFNTRPRSNYVFNISNETRHGDLRLIPLESLWRFCVCVSLWAFFLLWCLYMGQIPRSSDLRSVMMLTIKTSLSWEAEKKKTPINHTGNCKSARTIYRWSDNSFYSNWTSPSKKTLSSLSFWPEQGDQSF